jgi:hypothetical protein
LLNHLGWGGLSSNGEDFGQDTEKTRRSSSPIERIAGAMKVGEAGQ